MSLYDLIESHKFKILKHSEQPKIILIADYHAVKNAIAIYNLLKEIDKKDVFATEGFEEITETTLKKSYRLLKKTVTNNAIIEYVQRKSLCDKVLLEQLINDLKTVKVGIEESLDSKLYYLFIHPPTTACFLKNITAYGIDNSRILKEQLIQGKFYNPNKNLREKAFTKKINEIAEQEEGRVWVRVGKLHVPKIEEGLNKEYAVIQVPYEPSNDDKIIHFAFLVLLLSGK